MGGTFQAGMAWFNQSHVHGMGTGGTQTLALETVFVCPCFILILYSSCKEMGALDCVLLFFTQQARRCLSATNPNFVACLASGCADFDPEVFEYGSRRCPAVVLRVEASPKFVSN